MGTIIPIMGTINDITNNSLFSKAQQRVLTLLFSKSDQFFYTNEIIRLSQVGSGAIQRELAKLSHAGILIQKSVGNQKQYAVNPLCPIYPDLKNIINKTFGIADVLNDALTPLMNNISVAFIYGSIAKNKETINSDLDLLLIGEELSYAILFPLLESVELKLARTINPTCYSISDWLHKLKSGNNFLNKIMNQPKIFLIGSMDELNKLKQSD